MDSQDHRQRKSPSAMCTSATRTRRASRLHILHRPLTSTRSHYPPDESWRELRFIIGTSTAHRSARWRNLQNLGVYWMTASGALGGMLSKTVGEAMQALIYRGASDHRLWLLKSISWPSDNLVVKLIHTSRPTAVCLNSTRS
jgi:hypothetical protein